MLLCSAYIQVSRQFGGTKNEKMKKILYLSFFINFFTFYGQEFEFAVINDKDGFVNIRSSKNIKVSNIVDKLENGFIVTHFGAEGNWIDVEYEKNGKTQSGYVYKDRVINILNFTEIKKSKIIENEIIFSNRKIEVKITKKTFDKTKHSFKYYKDNPNQLHLIDEKEIFGTDGNLPKIEYNTIEIKIDSLKFILPKKAIENLYEPNLEYTTVNFDEKTETLYIRTLNGDGAGGYAVIWIIEKGKFKNRITTIPF